VIAITPGRFDDFVSQHRRSSSILRRLKPMARLLLQGAANIGREFMSPRPSPLPLRTWEMRG
jgi:hypothetical protein